MAYDRDGGGGALNRGTNEWPPGTYLLYQRGIERFPPGEEPAWLATGIARTAAFVIGGSVESAADRFPLGCYVDEATGEVVPVLVVP